jgi:hypothetical protein
VGGRKRESAGAGEGVAGVEILVRHSLKEKVEGVEECNCGDGESAEACELFYVIDRHPGFEKSEEIAPRCQPALALANVASARAPPSDDAAEAIRGSLSRNSPVHSLYALKQNK